MQGRRSMSHDIRTLHDHVDAASRSGDISQALPHLEAAIATSPARTDIRFLRATVLLSAQRYSSAIEEMNCILEMDPHAHAVRHQRALALFSQERLGEALDDFIFLSQKQPCTVEPWANAGIILLRMERPGDATPLLREAVRLRPDHIPLRRTLANALSGIGATEEALQLYESVIQLTPHDPAALTDYAMTLLSIGKPRDAHTHLLTALRIDPSDQTALAGIYLSANELALHDIVDSLINYPSLLSASIRPSSIALDRDALREAVLSHPGLVWQPAGRSTHQGRQSPMLDLAAGTPFSEFGQLIQHVVSDRIKTLKHDPMLQAHPWVRTLPSRWRLQAWCTVLDTGGRQTPHIHPAGRLSGVYYLDIGNASELGAGTLIFGKAPAEVATNATPRLHSITPKEDWICCFPSYFFHHTEPFQGTSGQRISLAFDVMPA